MLNVVKTMTILRSIKTTKHAYKKIATLKLNRFQCQLPYNGKMKKVLTRDFAQKHIMEKHSDKVSAIESDVGMFNNYLADPLRIRTVDIVPRLPMSAGGGGGGGVLAGGSPGMLQSPHMMRGPGGPRPVTSLPHPFFI
jgi:hypothetical protein